MQQSGLLNSFQEIHYPPVLNSGIKLFVLRDDLIHPFLSGNKWRKLKYNLPAVLSATPAVLVTYGGVWSNHLVATAAAGKIFGFKTIGIVRGDEGVSNEALQFMKECGMQLHFITREHYRLKNLPAFTTLLESSLRKMYPGLLGERPIFFLPEGGSNEAAVKGCEEIPAAIPLHSDFIACACGTGATLAGIAKAMKGNQKAIGISVLKGETFLEESILKLGVRRSQFEIRHEFNFGGYAKKDKELIDFCKEFHRETSVPVEPVYTGKLFFGLVRLITNGYFPKGSVVTAIHTGGIFDFTKTPEKQPFL